MTMKLMGSKQCGYSRQTYTLEKDSEGRRVQSIAPSTSSNQHAVRYISDVDLTRRLPIDPQEATSRIQRTRIYFGTDLV